MAWYKACGIVKWLVCVIVSCGKTYGNMHEKWHSLHLLQLWELLDTNMKMFQMKDSLKTVAWDIFSHPLWNERKGYTKPELCLTDIKLGGHGRAAKQKLHENIY